MQKTKWALFVAVIGFGMFFMSGCASSIHDPTEKYFLITINTKIPYWQSALAGLNHAANQMKVKAEMVGPDTYDPKAEHDEFRRVVAQKPTGIMISAADASIVGPDIDSALNAGIPVITIDS